ncbi:PASTA domain-containing protein [Nocardioides plantarum]|uniref:PASTA domain-containing protein n=1 Tax=Nocardioides plantarum TaxID=29299 RepID=A0ABV5KFS1_9ACTN|nr:PASTA domain-containing protein [Nocardioides plantarum]
MHDDRLTEMLDRAAHRNPVGAPPLAAIAAGGRRRRRTRAVGVVAAAAVVVAAGAGVAASLVSGPGSPPNAADAAASGDAPTVPTAPSGMRLVGRGSVVVAVPEGWATQATRCDLDGPKGDAVIVVDGVLNETFTEGVHLVCPQPAQSAGIERLMIADASPGAEDADGVERTEVDGVTAYRSEPTCSELEGVSTCGVSLDFPSLDVGLRAESTTSVEAAEKIFDRVQVLDGLVGVPGKLRPDQGEKKYVAALEAAGLVADVVEVPAPGYAPGYLRGISPAPGTVLAPGDTVKVEVAREPSGPEEEVEAELYSERPSIWLDDAEIRAGATIELPVDGRLYASATAYGYPEDARPRRTYGGTVSGDALEIAGSRSENDTSWWAVKPGIATITLTVDDADGNPVEVGTVTVKVVKREPGVKVWPGRPPYSES